MFTNRYLANTNDRLIRGALEAFQAVTLLSWPVLMNGSDAMQSRAVVMAEIWAITFVGLIMVYVANKRPLTKFVEVHLMLSGASVFVAACIAGLSWPILALSGAWFFLPATLFFTSTPSKGVDLAYKRRTLKEQTGL